MQKGGVGNGFPKCNSSISYDMLIVQDKDYITETIDIPKVYHALLQKQCQSQLQDIGKNSGATIRFPEPNTPLEAVAITAAPTRIKDVAKALLNLVPLTFTMVGDDPSLASIVESSDFHYAITDHLKVVYRIELTIKEHVDNTAKSPKPWSITFQFQYLRPHFEKLKEAINDVCRYVSSKGATLEPATPPEPVDPETKPFDQERSNSYGQSSVTQPYHSPAQIAAAAQGNLHPSFHISNQHGVNFHHHNFSQHGYLNGFHGHAQPHQHFGRGHQQIPGGSFGGNRATTNGTRQGHNVHHAGFYQGGYMSYQPGRGQGANHFGHYNAPQYIQSSGVNANMKGTNGYQRRFMTAVASPAAETHQSPSLGTMNYQQTPRVGGIVGQSPLETLSSLELPDVSGTANPNSTGFRPHQEPHTPGTNGSPYSPSAQSYFPPQSTNVHHNGFPPAQGYPSGPTGSRYQS